MVTAVEYISADGRCLEPTTNRNNWTMYPAPGWLYMCSESGLTDSYISLHWLKRVFNPQTEEPANKTSNVPVVRPRTTTVSSATVPYT